MNRRDALKAEHERKAVRMGIRPAQAVSDEMATSRADVASGPHMSDDAPAGAASGARKRVVWRRPVMLHAIFGAVDVVGLWLLLR